MEWQTEQVLEEVVILLLLVVVGLVVPVQAVEVAGLVVADLLVVVALAEVGKRFNKVTRIC